MKPPCIEADLCPERDGLGHWWLCPTPRGQEVVLVECRDCGKLRTLNTSHEGRTSTDYRRGSRRMIERVLTPGKKKQYRQRDLGLLETMGYGGFPGTLSLADAARQVRP